MCSYIFFSFSNSERKMFLFFSSLTGPSVSFNPALPSSSPFPIWNLTLKFLICPLLLFFKQISFLHLVIGSSYHPVSIFLSSCPSSKYFIVTVSILLSGFCLQPIIEIALLQLTNDCLINTFFWALILLDIYFWQLIIFPSWNSPPLFWDTAVPCFSSSTNCSSFHYIHGFFLQHSKIRCFPRLCPLFLASPSLIIFPIYAYVSNTIFMWRIPKVIFSQYLFCELLTYTFKCQQDMATLGPLWHLKHMTKLTSSSTKSMFLTFFFLFLVEYVLSQPRLKTLNHLLFV